MSDQWLLAMLHRWWFAYILRRRVGDPVKYLEGGQRQRPDLSPVFAGPQRRIRPQLRIEFGAVPRHGHEFLFECGEGVFLLVRHVALAVTAHDERAVPEIQRELVWWNDVVWKKRPLTGACRRKASQAPSQLLEVGRTLGVFF